MSHAPFIPSAPIVDKLKTLVEEQKKAEILKAMPVKRDPVIVGPKTGRNDLCVCGSGKKYKKCCLPKENS